MDLSNNDAVTAAANQRVPDDLVQQLHQANQQLHDARLALEACMDDSEFQHQARVDQAELAVRAAEETVEQISAKIHDAMAAQPIK